VVLEKDGEDQLENEEVLQNQVEEEYPTYIQEEG
jgi:hypothetical protein